MELSLRFKTVRPKNQCFQLEIKIRVMGSHFYDLVKIQLEQFIQQSLLAVLVREVFIAQVSTCGY